MDASILLYREIKLMSDQRPRRVCEMTRKFFEPFPEPVLVDGKPNTAMCVHCGFWFIEHDIER